jgi:hypothetical protein
MAPEPGAFSTPVKASGEPPAAAGADQTGSGKRSGLF